jgi:hypothetical protein
MQVGIVDGQQEDYSADGFDDDDASPAAAAELVQVDAKELKVLGKVGDGGQKDVFKCQWTRRPGEAPLLVAKHVFRGQSRTSSWQLFKARCASCSA